MLDKIMGLLKQCGRILLTAVLIFGTVMGFFATLKMAEFLGIAETLVKLVEALLSSVVVAVGVVVGFFVWLMRRYDKEIRNFMLRFKRGKIAGAEFELADPQAAGLAGDIPKDALPNDIRKKAEAGDAKSQLELGLMFYFGNGVKQDKAEAVKWWRRAAEQGDAKAQFNLGLMYHKGEGVLEEKKEAVKLYRLAADQGIAAAQCNLGLLYEHGEGVSQDKAEAVEWYRRAAEQGIAEAQCNLGFMYDQRQGHFARQGGGGQMVSPRRRTRTCPSAKQSRLDV